MSGTGYRNSMTPGIWKRTCAAQCSMVYTCLWLSVPHWKVSRKSATRQAIRDKRCQESAHGSRQSRRSHTSRCYTCCGPRVVQHRLKLDGRAPWEASGTRGSRRPGTRTPVRAIRECDLRDCACRARSFFKSVALQGLRPSLPQVGNLMTFADEDELWLLLGAQWRRFDKHRGRRV